jgi:hypothetical protein
VRWVPVAAGADARFVAPGVGDDGKPQLAVRTAMASDAAIRCMDRTTAS